MVELNCLNCGILFLNGRRKKHCSYECKEKYYLKNNFEKRKETYKKYRINSGRSKTLFVEGMKNKCKECNTLFEPTKFVPFKKYCSPGCRNNFITREWNKKNPDRLKDIQKKYYYSEKGRASQLRKYANPQSKELIRIWQKNNTEKVKDALRNFRNSDKGRAANRLINHNRRRLLMGLPVRNGKVDFDLVEKRDKFCVYCGRLTKRMTFDHVVPLVDGGVDVGNIVFCCLSCNSHKSDWSVERFLVGDYCVERGITRESVSSVVWDLLSKNVEKK